MTEQNFESMRRAMVASQLRTNAVNDPRVVAAMGEVPRERFVSAELAALAYVDVQLPLGDGRAINPPLALGRLLTEARPQATDRALVVGGATGYAAAVLAQLAAHVTALESDAGLLERARAAAADTRVAFVEGPLVEGWADGAPYDLILIDGAVETVPDALVAQLADGGRLATGLIEDGVVRLAVGTKSGAGFGLVRFAEGDVAPLPGFARPRGFSF